MRFKNYLQFLQRQESLDGEWGAVSHSAQPKCDFFEQTMHVMKVV